MRWQFPENNFSGTVVERLLQARGIPLADTANFLSAGKDQIHDCSLMYGVDAAADIILEHIKAGKKIFIHGDYDVDGVCATSLMWLFLSKHLKADVLPKIPNRFDEGYGLSSATLDDVVAQGGKLVITVDSGIKDKVLIDKYRAESGLEFVVTDHHTIAGELPEGVAIVHPRHPQGNYPFGEICGATVAWKLCQMLARKAGIDDSLAEYLDLVALATVCDVMPLIDENRAIVKLGVAELQHTQRPGMQALMEVSGIKPGELKTYHLSFVMGPKLNAAGRLQDAMVAMRLLSTDNMANARQWAQELNQLNQERQSLTSTLLESAEQQISKFPSESKLYFVYGDEWPEGVVGLVAGKLTEKYSRPVLVASRSKEGVVKGSARSIRRFHIAEALQQAEHLLTRHGGHAMAAGFTLSDAQLSEFADFMADLAGGQISTEDLVPILNIDLKLEMTDVNADLVEELKSLEPFGFGNPNPVVAITELVVAKAPRFFGNEKQHASFVAQDAAGRQVEIVDWNGSERWQSLKARDVVSVAGNLGLNEWNGNRTVQIVAKDILL